MIALDTNVLARLLLDDDRAQTPRARALIENKDQIYWIPITVVLELAWLLASKGWAREKIAEGLKETVTLENMRPQHPEAVHHALDWFAKGADFPDALHVALSAQADELKTFDADLAKKAAALALSPSVTLA